MKITLLIGSLIASLFLSPSIHAKDIIKVWEVPIKNIFPQGKLASEFYPIFTDSKIIFGATNGQVSSLELSTLIIDEIINLPINIQKSQQFDRIKNSNYAVFFGQNKRNGNFYYYTIDIAKKRVKGFIPYKYDFLSLGEYAVFEKNGIFRIFHPKQGRGVYNQSSSYKFFKPIFTQDSRRYLFQTYGSEIIEISLPKFAGSMFAAKKQLKSEIIDFSFVTAIKKNMVADNITGDIMFYHTKMGSIGQMDVALKKVIWERKYFKADMKIQGPLIDDEKLYYLVSYPKSDEKRFNSGKLICLNRLTGQSFWISRDLPYNNFGIVQFDKFIISTDTSGNILFLDRETGKVAEKFFVGDGVATPYVNKNELYILTESKIYKFFNNRLAFKLKIMWESLVEKLG